MIEFYKKYFKNLAINCVHIAHTEEEPAFFYVSDKYNLKAFDDAIKSAAKTPAMLLERYSLDLDDNGNQNHFDNIQGRFTILLKTEVGDQQSIELVEIEAERIAKIILKKMRLDFFGIEEVTIGDLTAKVQFKIKRVQIDAVGPVNGSYYGVSVGFTWNCPLSVNVNDADWS